MVGRWKDPNKNNDFYRNYYNYLIFALMGGMVALIALVCLVLYQIFHRPLPAFAAIAPNNQQMQLTASTEPNLLSNTILKWASKAAVAAYTFDFENYSKQLDLARPYFTAAGWTNYQNSILRLLQDITQNQLFVNGVVAGAPIISNEGELPGRGYVWRVQIPFLVTYQSSEQTTSANYTVVITIVRVPTAVNPAGIGIDQFVMS